MSMIGPNALSPSRMTAAERLDELAGILAVGVMRLAALKSRDLSAHSGECSLDLTPDQSGHANTLLKSGETHDR